MAIDIRKWLENRFADYEVVGEQPGTYGRAFSINPAQRPIPKDICGQNARSW
jgi:hypothetical protein